MIGQQVSVYTMLCVWSVCKTWYTVFSVLLKPTKNTQIPKRVKQIQANLVTMHKTVSWVFLHIQGQFIYIGVALFDVFYLGTSMISLFSITVLISGLQKGILFALNTFVLRNFKSPGFLFINHSWTKMLKVGVNVYYEALSHKRSQAWTLFNLIMLCVQVVYEHKYTVIMVHLYFELL